MFKFPFLTKYFRKEKKLKKFSSTLTDVTVGSDQKADLNPDIKQIMADINVNETISNEELNKLITFYFNKPAIEHHLYTLNKPITDGMCFEISKINTVSDNNKNVENIVFTMKELTYDGELTLSISIKNFHEYLKPLNLVPITEER